MRRASFALLVAGLIGCRHDQSASLDPRLSRETLTGDESSQALGINKYRQVVGASCGATKRAFLWENRLEQWSPL